MEHAGYKDEYDEALEEEEREEIRNLPPPPSHPLARKGQRNSAEGSDDISPTKPPKSAARRSIQKVETVTSAPEEPTESHAKAKSDPVEEPAKVEPSDGNNSDIENKNM